MVLITVNHKKILCPYCGYSMPLYYTDDSTARGVFVRCKGRNCKKMFEINNDILAQEKAPVFNKKMQS